MLRGTRVSRHMDVARLGAALARPGMDPRIWVSLAVVTAVNVETGQGVFADVVMLPSELPATARLGAVYAGSGFGVYAPLKVDDEVLVEAPSGDPAEGLVVTHRLWSRSDPPPTGAASHPDDLVIVIAPGKSVRIGVSGGGKAMVGGVEAASPMVLGDVLKQALLDAVAGQAFVSPAGPVFGIPAWSSKYLTAAATNILSGKALTER